MERQSFGEEELNAKFFVRILPTLDFSSDSIKIEASAKAMYVKCLRKSVNREKAEKPYFWCFGADGIFWNRSQEDVCGAIGEDLVSNALSGVSGIVMAFGQTGSGKTFTVSGLRYRYETRGFVLRLLESLCRERDECRDLRTVSISISYVEFTKAGAKDLLSDKSVDSIKGVKKMKIVDEANTWRLVFGAEARKSFNDGAPYKGSHKGHTVFTVHVESLSLVDSHPVPTSSKVHVVDMAGVDSAGKMPTAWRSRSDLGYSNLTKTLMEQIIVCMSGKTWRTAGCVCPHRTMKLLDYLHDALQPRCIVRFVGHIIGNDANIPVTLSVLRFGEKIRGLVPTKLQKVVLGNDPLCTVKALEMDVARLRAELDLNEILTGSRDYSNLSQERIQQVKKPNLDARVAFEAAKGFLLGDVEKLTLLSLGQTEITLDTFKELYAKVTSEKELAVKEAVLNAMEEVQAQFTSERPFPNTSCMAKTSRRRSGKQQESQMFSSTPMRSSETSIGGSRRPLTANAQVGNIDRNGIAIGPERNVVVSEGFVVKAMKKVRSRRSDVLIRPGPRSSSVKGISVPYSKDLVSDDLQNAFPEKVPSREEAWQAFCLEKDKVVHFYQGEISRLEEDVRISRKNYVKALCSLGKLKDALGRVKKEWDDWKHISNLYEYSGDIKENQGEESEEGTTKFFEDDVERKEAELSNAVENCHVTFHDFRSAIEQLTDTKSAFEDEFQLFCSDVFKVNTIPEDFKPADFKLSQEIRSDADVDNARINLYYELQEKMLNYIPKSKKKEWVRRF